MRTIKNKIIVVVLIIIAFVLGYNVGIIHEIPLLPSYNTSYPAIYTADSSVDNFDGYTGEQLNSILKGTKLEGLGFWFSYYAWQNNISSLYLTAHAIHESAWGTSFIARYKHNLFGFGAYDSSPYWSANYYASYRECVQQVSSYIAKEYLTESGLWYEGDTLRDINVHYASDKQWCNKVANIMNMLAYKLGKPQKTLAIAENEYYQNFTNKDYDLSQSFDKYVSKGQFIRDMYMLFPIREDKQVYTSAGAWAISKGLIKPTSKWWINKITRNEEINIINKLYAIYFPYKQPPQFQSGDYYEKYSKYYVYIIYKLRRSK